jgi:peptide-methionine (S)-S-oxide reductase
MDKVSFGGGCFWGVEHAFKQLDGVINTVVGYQGGSKVDPTYEEVCSKETGHAEVVLVEYDPQVLTLERLLDAFFYMHDPTQLNRQGPDVGSQYRSVIFPTHDLQEKRINDYFKEKLLPKFGERLVTTIEKGEFFNAEDFHQLYLANNPGGYCHIGFDIFLKLKTGQF